ncbi:MAG: hypothetical protein HKO02_04600 [Hyphomonadaceae bacterium]|nr:hypothetical protein [Hyphomonadaceae bacterium]
MENISTEAIMVIVGVFTLGFWLGGKLMKADNRTIGVDTPSGRMTTKTGDVDYEISGDDLERIIGALENKRKIEAIKIFRDVTGAGLKDAKDAVEMMDRHRKAHP